MNSEENSLESEFLGYATILELSESQEEMSFADLKNATDLVRTFLDSRDAKSMRAISALDIELSNLETELANKNRQLIAKDKEIDELKKQLESISAPKVSENLTYKNGHWYANDSNSPQAPVCRNCTDKLNRIVFANPPISLGGQSFPPECPECKSRV